MIVKDWVLFDLDHTLSNAARRDHLIPTARASDDWHEYHSDLVNDAVCSDILEMMWIFRADKKRIGIITARPERYRDLTVGQLHKFRAPYDTLLMHKRDQWEPSAELKIRLAEDFFEGKIAERVLFIVDDHPEVVRAFAKIGVTALQVHGRNYD